MNAFPFSSDPDPMHPPAPGEDAEIRAARLTAFALGEMPAEEQAKVEAELAESPDAQAEVEATREMAQLLATALAREAEQTEVPPLPAVGERHLDDPPSTADAPSSGDVMSGDAENTVVRPPLWRWRTLWGVAAAAACLVAMLALFGVLPGSRWVAGKQVLAKNSPRETAPSAAEIDRSAAGPAAASAAVERTAVVEQPPAADALAPSVPPPPASPRGDAPAPTRISPTPPPTTRPDPSGTVVDHYRGGPQGTPPVSAPPTPTARTAVRGGSPRDLPGTVPGESYGMQPQLMKRYGLMPAPQGQVSQGVVSAPFEPSSKPESRSSHSAALSVADSARTFSATPAMAGGGAGDYASAERAGAPPSPESGVRYRMPAPMPTPPPPGYLEREQRWSVEGANPGYLDAQDTPFVSPLTQPLSTFGLDVDTGSYANVRRFLKSGMFPPRGAVRVEEMINYFPYRYASPRGDDVFGVQTDVAACPWEPRHRLVRVAIKARDLAGERPVGNLVFLIDVSGSMQPSERLPLIKQGLRALVKRMAPSDRVAIVTYASSAGVVLPSTSCEEKDRILEAIDALDAGGSTNGEGGIRQAYEVARRHFVPGGVNRVLLCTDGDFNVGISDQNELVRIIEDQARSGVFLTTLGVGTDNFKDALMRRLADRGNGSYHYLDSFEEAQRVLLEQRDATFVTVARDAKAQVEFNPGRVSAWRLIGYEKRLLAAQDFNDDTKDAGEIGAGQTVTVLYEVVPAGEAAPGTVDPLKYQPAETKPTLPRAAVDSRDLLTVKLRYQRPEGSRSVLKEYTVEDRVQELSGDFRFAAAVAAFGMALRDPYWDGGRGLDRALSLGQGSLGEDPGGWRAEFLTLVRKARGIPRR